QYIGRAELERIKNVRVGVFPFRELQGDFGTVGDVGGIAWVAFGGINNDRHEFCAFDAAVTQLSNPIGQTFSVGSAAKDVLVQIGNVSGIGNGGSGRNLAAAHSVEIDLRSQRLEGVRDCRVGITLLFE